MDLEELRTDWEKLCVQLGEAYADGEKMDIDGMLFLVGINELGKGPGSFKKDEKLELMHIAICTVLEPYGYYSYDGEDEEGWPHYTLKEKLPALKPGQQSILMKEALVNYFRSKGVLL